MEGLAGHAADDVADVTGVDLHAQFVQLAVGIVDGLAAFAGGQFFVHLFADVVGDLGGDRPERLRALADIGFDAALDALARFQRRIAGRQRAARLRILRGLIDHGLHAVRGGAGIGGRCGILLATD